MSWLLEQHAGDLDPADLASDVDYPLDIQHQKFFSFKSNQIQRK
jgi:hypothetical protein